MYPNPLIYCTCWDPWNLGPRKLIKTPRPPHKISKGKPKLSPLAADSKKQDDCQLAIKPLIPNKPSPLGMKINFGKQSMKLPYEVVNVSPGYRLVRNREQISVTLGDELFDRKKPSDTEITSKIGASRTNIISDLEEQISELTAIIEQLNRDHQAAQKLLASEMETRCAELEQNFENKHRYAFQHRPLYVAVLASFAGFRLTETPNSLKGSLEGVHIRELMSVLFSFCPEELRKEYKYLKNMFHVYQDSIHDEMEDKWSKRKAEWEKDERMEREKILLQQKHRMTKRFEVQSEEEKKRINHSYTTALEIFNREKEEFLKQHENNAKKLEELAKTKETIQEELHAQAVVLESLNTTLYQTQLELQKEKTAVMYLEKTLQTKFTEAEEKYKSTIHLLTQENMRLRQKLVAKNEETYEGRSGRLASINAYEDYSDILEDGRGPTRKQE
ncbi:flagellum-associated coiled-coil domain-containing protein 1 [Echinops telfairi]|uniref:Flagellum-associated coiled-coil domain-containing protein 1 n=1 Tax=Echinops telfairi TaxID=9371 RepID=A0AC55DLF0_ECHTE|nr:flagellum-associated coiled-coil domain-containing protein 1 [Echinops telfairi]